MRIFNIFDNDSTITVNGKVINRNNNNLTSKKFNKIKRESSENVNCIYIDSNDINVNVFAANTDYITAQLHGSAITDNDIELSVIKDSNDVKISVQVEPNYISTSFGFSNTTVINMGSNQGLVLDVIIPAKVFNGFHFKSNNASISLDQSVKFNSVIINTKNGKVNISSAFQNAVIDSHNGNITINSKAYCDTINVISHNAKFDISTPFKNLYFKSHNGTVNVNSKAYCDTTLNIDVHNANVTVKLDNIATSKVTVSTKNGRCQNNPKLQGKYNVSGYIKSHNGNIKFQ